MKIVGKLAGKMECKRFLLNGVKVLFKCPECGCAGYDCGEPEGYSYLSYPKMNKPMDYDFYCDECEHEWSERVILKVKLEKA